MLARVSVTAPGLPPGKTIQALLLYCRKNMRILVTGKDGQVGQEIIRLLPARFEVISAGRAECDLSHPQEIRDLVRRIEPAVVVNAAAYTAVDKAETETDLCFAINAAAPRVLAEEAARLDALLVHYSTDYVFDGRKTEPYLESDAIAPLGVYGASKAEGERGIAASSSRSIVLRTSWVYSAHGKNFLRTILRLAAERPELRVVDDQIGAPTSAAAIAAATVRLIERYAPREAAVPGGLYHMTASGESSWCGFARAILNPLTSKPPVIAISTSDYPTPARRPGNSVLSNEKFERTFGFRLTSWQQQLEEVMTTVFSSDERVESRGDSSNG
jgi:dTDP-4-dehydrorhamnose reductase